MSRLIDADKLKERIMDSFPTLKHTAKGICEIIDAQPTAYDLDGVVEKLEMFRTEAISASSYCTLRLLLSQKKYFCR